MDGGETCTIVLAFPGGVPSDAATVWRHGSADRRTTAADLIGAAAGQADRSKAEEDGQLSEKSLQNKAFSGFLCPQGQGLVPSPAAEAAKEKKQ